MNETFNKWLIEEMKARGWSQADLARNSGTARATISNLLNEVRNPGTELISALAEALDYPVEFVMRKAGILSPAPRETEKREELNHLFDKLPEDEKDDLLDYLHIKLEMLERTGKVRGRA
ncbi:helix-turn-helix domain-containing protein [bacterium]|nr:helix-turn-helix domain-containing protein [bacterium]